MWIITLESLLVNHFTPYFHPIPCCLFYSPIPMNVCVHLFLYHKPLAPVGFFYGGIDGLVSYLLFSVGF